jgi:hypothetical protein
VWPASTTARPSAIARCVLPTPGAPKSSTSRNTRLRS